MRRVFAIVSGVEGSTEHCECTEAWQSVQFGSGFAHSLHRLTSKRMLVVTVPSDGVPALTILDEELEASSINIGWHNGTNPWDVDDDQSVTPLDALRIIDQINKHGSRQGEGVGEIFCDVDNDGSISPLDVLSVINWLNSKSGGEAEGVGDRSDFAAVRIASPLSADLEGKHGTHEDRGAAEPRNTPNTRK